MKEDALEIEIERKMNEMKLSVTKTFRTETAHRLSDNYPEEGCFFPHGHSFTYDITFALRKDQDLDDTGFVIELSKLNKVRTWLEANWDHALLLNSRDSLKKTLEGSTFKTDSFIYLFQDRNPTIENMALELASVIETIVIDSRCYLSKLVVRETAFQYCTLELKEN